MSIFSMDWRACLREQYKQVFRIQDSSVKESLTDIMLRAGFTEAELAQLCIEATMRTEDAPADFVPDLDILSVTETQSEAQIVMPVLQSHPDDCQCPVCMEIQSNLPDDEEQSITAMDEEAPDILNGEDEDADLPKQLTMF